MRIPIFLEHPVPAFSPTPELLEALAARLPEHELLWCRDLRTFVAELPRADAALVWYFEAGWYARAPRLLHVFTPAAGKELVAPDPSGRVPAHHGRFHGQLMAESLLGMMLFMNRRLGLAVRAQERRVWDREVYASGRRLRGQTALIVGYGAIGEHAGALLSSLGVRVLGLRREPSRGGAFAEHVYGADQLLEAVAEADHVVCIVPGGRATDGLLGRAAFERMKPTAYVYNLGRGNAIDADALLDALTSSRIAGAFLDVVPEEPLPASSPLWTAPNCYLTPHASAVYADYLWLYADELVTTLQSL